MDKFLSDLKQTVSGAVRKSGELVEISKLKLAIGDTKSEIRSSFKQLGELTYLAAKGEEEESKKARELIDTIDALKEKLAEQEQKLAEISKKKVCGGCGKVNAEDAYFCSQCGNSI